MCTNYRPSSRETIRDTFGVDVAFEYPGESWGGYTAPIVRQHEDRLVVEPARFGLIPPWCPDEENVKKLTRGTLNARRETIAEKPSFKDAWRKGQFCLIPMNRFYEPCYESGRAERWSVSLSSETDFCVAAIWSQWGLRQTGSNTTSFAMVTLNADGHTALKRLHKPHDEKRSIYVVERRHYSQWLNATPEEAQDMMCLMPPESYVLQPALPVKSAPRTGDLF